MGSSRRSFFSTGRSQMAAPLLDGRRRGRARCPSAASSSDGRHSRCRASSVRARMRSPTPSAAPLPLALHHPQPRRAAPPPPSARAPPRPGRCRRRRRPAAPSPWAPRPAWWKARPGAESISPSSAMSLSSALSAILSCAREPEGARDLALPRRLRRDDCDEIEDLLAAREAAVCARFFAIRSYCRAARRAAAVGPERAAGHRGCNRAFRPVRRDRGDAEHPIVDADMGRHAATFAVRLGPDRPVQPCASRTRRLCSQLRRIGRAASGRYRPRRPAPASQAIVVSVETAPSTLGSGGIGARASAAMAATLSWVTLPQIGEVHMVDRVAIDGAVLGPAGPGAANCNSRSRRRSGSPGSRAAGTAIWSPPRPNRSLRQIWRTSRPSESSSARLSSEAREVARRRVVLAAKAALLGDQLGRRVPPRGLPRRPGHGRRRRSRPSRSYCR